MRQARITMRDPSLPHQIVIIKLHEGNKIAVSCNCRGTPASSYAPLEVRTLWEPGEAIARWREHMAEVEAVA